MKTTDLIRTAAANTVRSKLRTTLTVLALFVGAFTLTLTTALGAGISDYVTKQVASFGASNVLLVSKASETTPANDGPQKYDPASAGATTGGVGAPGAAGAGAPSLSATDISTLESVKGLSDVSPLESVSIDWIATSSSDKYKLALGAASSIATADIKAGSQLDASSSKPELTLPNDYVKALGLGSAQSAIGTTVTLGLTDVLGASHEVTATVVGIANASLLSTGVGANSALIDEVAKVQKASSTAPVRYGNAVAYYDKNATSAEIEALKKSIADKGMTAQTVADQLGTIQTIISAITTGLSAFAVIALLAAAFGIVNTLLMSVQERTREIGLMKAMGMSNGRVFALFSLEAAFIGFLGSAIGAGIAIGIGIPISNVLAGGALSSLAGLQLLLFQPLSIVGVMALIIAIAFLAGTLPARRAARKTPIDALRYE